MKEHELCYQSREVLYPNLWYNLMGKPSVRIQVWLILKVVSFTEVLSRRSIVINKLFKGRSIESEECPPVQELNGVSITFTNLIKSQHKRICYF